MEDTWGAGIPACPADGVGRVFDFHAPFPGRSETNFHALRAQDQIMLYQDLGRILRIFVNQSDATKGEPGGADERLLDAEVLAFKVVQHAISALVLSRGTSLEDLGFKTCYKDVFSVFGLARMCHECYLLFSHLFVTFPNNEEADFRFLAWRYVDARRQARFPIHDPEAHSANMELGQTADKLQARLEANTVFRNIPKKKQDRIRDLKWPLLGWPELGGEAGFNDLHATQMYRYLSSYAHPGSLGVRQVRRAAGDRLLGQLAEIGLKHAAIMVACLVADYPKVFNSARVVLEVDEVGRKLVDFYQGLARFNSNSKGV